MDRGDPFRRVPPVPPSARSGSSLRSRAMKGDPDRRVRVSRRRTPSFPPEPPGGVPRSTAPRGAVSCSVSGVLPGALSQAAPA